MLRQFPHRVAARATVAAALAAALVTLACDNSSPPSGPEPGIRVLVGPEALSLAPGQTLGVTVAVVRYGDFMGNVTLAASGAPDGVELAFERTLLSGAKASSALILTAQRATAPGAYPLTITSLAEGVVDSTRLWLTVTETWPEHSISLAPAIDAFSMVEGQWGELPVTVTTAPGFPDEVLLAVQGLPGGVTATFDPAVVPAIGGSSRLRITTSPAAAGAYQLQLTGSSIDFTSSAAPIDLTVLAGPAPAMSVWVPRDHDEVFVDPMGWFTDEPFFIWVTRAPGYEDAVELSAEGLPQGVQFDFSPSVLNPAEMFSKVTPSAGSNAPLTTRDVTVRACGPGVPDATFVIKVTVW
jgi:hypothetical protein